VDVKQTKWEHALAVIPVTLLSAGFALDLTARLSERREWAEAGFWIVALGLIAGFIAAPLLHRSRGLAEWNWIPHRTHRREDRLTIAMLVAFSAAWLLQRVSPGTPSALSLFLGFLGTVAAIAGSWQSHGEPATKFQAEARPVLR
jgi:uncharacterized membrane protein